MMTFIDLCDGIEKHLETGSSHIVSTLLHYARKNYGMGTADTLIFKYDLNLPCNGGHTWFIVTERRRDPLVGVNVLGPHDKRNATDQENQKLMFISSKLYS